MNHSGRMERVLVTGAAGFVGSHLVEKLAERKVRVRAFIRYNSRNSWGWLENSPLKKNIEFCPGDIRDYQSVRKAMEGIQTVFHLAALVGVPYSYHSPLSYIKTNVMGTYNVLEAAREAGIKKIIQTSTSEVYGTAQIIPMKENHPLHPQSPYAASKASADHLGLSYYASFGLPVTILRPFNIFGPRQSARAIIPTILCQALKQRDSIKLGSLLSSRDWLYIDDAVEGFLSVKDYPESEGEIIHIGTGIEVSIKHLIQTIEHILNINLRIESDPTRIRPDNSEVQRLRADISKARRLLDWNPRSSLQQGLKETITWIKKNLDLYKSSLYNI